MLTDDSGWASRYPHGPFVGCDCMARCALPESLNWLQCVVPEQSDKFVAMAALNVAHCIAFLFCLSGASDASVDSRA
jgi:hypothetical protein